jgi:hypothetical protein
VSDAVALLPGLAQAAVADVRFTRIHDFEYRAESVVFDLLDVFLVHGWLVDPAEPAAGADARAAAPPPLRSH